MQHPAQKRALGAARSPALPGGEGGQRTRRLVRGEHAPVGLGLPPVVGLGQKVPLPDPVQQRVSVKRDEPRPRVDRQEQRGDIAHPDEWLRVRRDRGVIDPVEVAERESAADQGPDRPDLGVAEEVVELIGHLVRPGGCPPPGLLDVNQWRGPDAKPERRQFRDTALEHLELRRLEAAG